MVDGLLFVNEMVAKRIYSGLNDDHSPLKQKYPLGQKHLLTETAGYTFWGQNRPLVSV